MVRLVFIAMCLFAVAGTAKAEDRPPLRRHVGSVLGWDVQCTMRASNQAMASCGLNFREGNIEVIVGVGRSVVYTVTKDCGQPHSYWRRAGSIRENDDLSILLTDVVKAARFDERILDSSCVAQKVPSAASFENLETLLMILRTFPPSPENKGMWFN